jgi:hypothetical protein
MAAIASALNSTMNSNMNVSIPRQYWLRQNVPITECFGFC